MNIGIVEQNSIFRESLKTVLDQIPGFKVVFDMGTAGPFEGIGHLQVNLILVDYDLGKTKCTETMNKAVVVWPDVSFLLLTSYREEFNFESKMMADVILKNSTKQEFASKINKLRSN
jgi:DNA-binding NarL/FixJ family response regulator